jgi:hypothetical protein
MSELDLTNIVNSSISTPASGVTAVFADTDGNVKFKNSAGTLVGLLPNAGPVILAGTASVPLMTLTPAGTLMTTPTAGVQEADAAAFYNTLDTTNGRRFNDSWNLFRLAANGSALNAIQDFFGSTDGIPLVGTAVYEIEWHVYFAIAALGGTVTWTLTNTGTLTNMVASYEPISAIGGLGASASAQAAGAGVVTSTTAIQALPVSQTLTITTNHYHIIRALIEQNGTGNVRLRCTGGTTTTIQPLRGSYAKIRRLPAGNAGAFVA